MLDVKRIFARARWTGIHLLLPALGLGLAIIYPLIATAATTTIIRSFVDDPNGSQPSGGLTRDADGNFVGTTTGDGGGASTIFRIQPDGSFITLHTFDFAHGSSPDANVTLDANGVIYGTARTGGDPCFSCGVVFRATRNGGYAVLFAFADDGKSGLGPLSPLLRDSKSALYGTTDQGGANGLGVVYKLKPNGKQIILHAFAGAEGARPHNAGVVMDAEGNLYGTTYMGGDFNRGTVFKITPSGKYTVMHSFAGTPDGDSPNAGVIIDKDGNLFGTTQYGGSSSSVGTVFKVTSSGQETVIARFNGTNGAYPLAPVIMGGGGALFGTTSTDATSCGCGVVFKVTTGGQIFTLHRFTDIPDGREPRAGLTLDKAGNLYGTTYHGGTSGKGTVFRVTN